MQITISEMNKINVYVGCNQSTMEQLKEWLSVGLDEPFNVDEFIEWAAIEHHNY